MIDTDRIFEYLLELNQVSALELINTYFKEARKLTMLVFPHKGNNVIRVSEQELRFVMTHLLGKCNYLNLNYAIEVPTEEKYTFKGSNKRSASTDLALYDGINKVLNIELKANNPTQASVDKDIEKLTNENVHGAWCHILENEDSGTLKSILKKIEVAFDNAFKKHGKPSKKPLFFSFLILNKRVLISRKGKDGEEMNYLSNSIFFLDYKKFKGFINGNLINSSIDGWQLNKY